MDYGHAQTDEQLRILEKRIRNEYKQAASEVKKKLDRQLKALDKEDRIKAKQLADGQITKDEYLSWRTSQMLTSGRWQSMRQMLVKTFDEADKTARSLIRDTAYDAYALNFNFGTFEAERGAKVNTAFTLYDRDTVKRLLRDNPKLIPNPGKKTEERIRKGELKRWNEQKIQSVMTQGLLQGESIPKISTRLAVGVGEMNMHSAIRAARTMTTASENAGRLDSYRRAKELGIDIKKRWLATLDGRTRHSHRQLDMEVQEIEDRFSNGLMFPSDPDGAPAEVYNCRCTLESVIPEYETGDVNRRTGEGFKDYETWKNEHDELSSSRGTEPTGTKEKIISDEALVEKVKKLPQKFGEVDNMIKVVDDDIAMESARKFNALREKGTDKIEDYKLKSIPFSELETRQKWLDIEKLEDMAESGKLTEIASQDRMDVIRAIEYKGHTILIDGNHRANLLKLKGHKRIMVYVRKVG